MGASHASTGPDSRFTRRRHRLRAGLSQLLFIVAGLVAGIFVPKITVPPLVTSGKIVDLLFTAGVTVISLVTVIYSLLFVVVAIGNNDKVSVIVPVVALILVVGALAFMRVLQTRAFVSMLLAPTLTAITERGREVLDGLYRPTQAAHRQPVQLPSLKRTVTWLDQPTVLQQLHLVPLSTTRPPPSRRSTAWRACLACSLPGPTAPTSSSTMRACSGSSSACRDGRTSPAASSTT